MGENTGASKRGLEVVESGQWGHSFQCWGGGKEREVRGAKDLKKRPTRPPQGGAEHSAEKRER